METGLSRSPVKLSGYRSARAAEAESAAVPRFFRNPSRPKEP
jgi:hypothetical protein